MAGAVVFESTAEDSNFEGTLFQGIKFWLSQKVPQRTRFICDVRANGGQIVPLEKQADVKIVDHARKEVQPGTHSYRFIEKSVRQGALEDLDDHVVGPPQGTARTIGSVVRPPKATRVKYTQEDDRILWDWVHSNLQPGGGTDGNEIYKQLEAKHPQHPWQSWRDHWVKHLKGKPRPIYPPNNAPPTPPADPIASRETAQESKASVNETEDADDFDSFSEGDEQELLKWGRSIIEVDPEQADTAWHKWAKGQEPAKPRTAERWRKLWDQKVLPRYLKKQAKRAEQSQHPEATVKPSREVHHSPAKESPARRPQSHQSGVQIVIQYPQIAEQEDVAPQPAEQATDVQVKVTTPVGSTFLRKRKRGDDGEHMLLGSPEIIEKDPQDRKSSLKLPKEIASTPGSSPIRKPRISSPGLFVGEEDDAGEEASDPSEADVEDIEELGHPPSESLSEPDRSLKHSQNHAREQTPFIDFDVAPPEGGWESETTATAYTAPVAQDGGDDDLESGSRYTSANEQLSPQRPRASAVETQALFASQTQAADLTVPEPEDGWDGEVGTPAMGSPEAKKSVRVAKGAANGASPAPAPAADADIQDQLGAWIAAQAAKGITESTVENILNRTCMDTEVAMQALAHIGALKRKHGKSKHSSDEGALEMGYVPVDWRGVWTDQDDEDLYSPDARRVSRLVEKHKDEGLAARWEFLAFMADDE